MRNKKIKYWLIFLAFFLINIRTLKVNAGDSVGMTFSVSPQFSDTQINQEVGFYYIETVPNESQTIEVILSSSIDEPQQIKMTIEDAFTGYNGATTYGIDGEKGFYQDKTLIHPVTELVIPDMEVVDLAPRENKTVTFTLKSPPDHYDGIKLGQMTFKRVAEETKGLFDEYMYGLSIILSESGDEYDDGELTNIVLNEVKPTLKRGKRLVTANFQNPYPKRVVDLNMTATITEKEKMQIVKEKKMTNFNFSPNTNVDFEIDWGLAELKPGDYTFQLTANNAYDEVVFEKDFRITGKQAMDINNESAFKIYTPKWVKIIAIVSGLAGLIISTVIIVRNKKWLVDSRKRRKKRKRLSN